MGLSGTEKEGLEKSAGTKARWVEQPCSMHKSPRLHTQTLQTIGAQLQYSTEEVED